MRVTGNKVLVIEYNTTDIVSGGIVIETSTTHNRSCGKILSVGEDVPDSFSSKIGDTVFMSSDAGIYISKKELPDHVILDYREIVGKGNKDEDIQFGEDNEFYMNDILSGQTLNKTAQH